MERHGLARRGSARRGAARSGRARHGGLWPKATQRRGVACAGSGPARHGEAWGLMAREFNDHCNCLHPGTEDREDLLRGRANPKRNSERITGLQAYQNRRGMLRCIRARRRPPGMHVRRLLVAESETRGLLQTPGGPPASRPPVLNGERHPCTQRQSSGTIRRIGGPTWLVGPCRA